MASNDGTDPQRGSSSKAIVSFAQTSFALSPGMFLTCGRGSECGFRFAHDPVDARVARHALTLECGSRGVLIYNESRNHEIYMEIFDGRQFCIAPLMVVGTMPHTRAKLSVFGENGTRYVILLDMSGIGGAG